MKVVYENEFFYVKQMGPELFLVRRMGDFYANEIDTFEVYDKAKEKADELCEIVKKRSTGTLPASVGDRRVQFGRRRAKGPGSQTRARSRRVKGRQDS